MDKTAEFFPGSPTGLEMTFNGDTELYQVNLSTKNNFVEGTDYRIEIWGVAITAGQRTAVDERWLFGWRDVRNSPDVASCGEEAFCHINFGQTIPVKVRIEDFVLCPVSRNCAVQFVASGEPAALQAGENGNEAQLQIPALNNGDFALGFEPCSTGPGSEDEQVTQAVALPTFGPCFKTVSPPGGVGEIDPVTEGDLAIFVLCTIDVSSINPHSDPTIAAAQREELKLGHFSTGGVPDGPITQVEAWPEVDADCGDPTSGNAVASAGSQGGLLALARNAGDWALSLFRPQPLLAVHIGVGSSGCCFDSFWKLLLPGKFEYVPGEDGTGIAPVGSDDVPLTAVVTDLDDRPVEGARVGWEVFDSPPDGEGGASAPVNPIFTGPDGKSTATVTLSGAEGDNVFHATGHGIADVRESGCTLPGGSEGAASCNGPRAFFDPFQPEDNGVTEIFPTGTRLPFTITGCVSGRGTPNIDLADPNAQHDGVMEAGEWECAESETIEVNLSGGSTVDATFFWMNDDGWLHLAVAVPGTDRKNALHFEWDSDGSGSRSLGDDVWAFDPDGGPADKFVDDKCSGSGQSSCGVDDAAFDGSMDTRAGFSSQGGMTVYEMSHPISKGDICKVVVGNGKNATVEAIDCDMMGIIGGAAMGFGTLTLGSGAQGDTQFPGFLQYFTIILQ